MSEEEKLAEISATIMPARLDWPSAIGNFILNFGVLELRIFEFLETRLSPEEFAKFRKGHLQDRINRIADLLEDPEFDAEQRSLFEEFRKKLDPVRELRNHLAHGHPLIRIKPGTTERKLTIYPSRDTNGIFETDAKHLEFQDLLDGLKNLDETSKLFEQFRGTKWHDPVQLLRSEDGKWSQVPPVKPEA